MSLTQTLSIPLNAVGPGRWTTLAGPEWSNPGGGLWGGYAIGLCVRVLEAEPDAVGEALSLTLTYAAGLPSGDLDIRTRRLRQGGSIGVWEVEVLPAGSDQVGVHGIVTMARRPNTPDFAFARMPAAPDPETLPSPEAPVDTTAPRLSSGARSRGFRRSRPGILGRWPGFARGEARWTRRCWA